MVTHNNNLLCKQAELYYYDFLSKENIGFIPKNITDHINKCQYCRGKINQLNTILSLYNATESKDSQVDIAMRDLLKLHLAYIDNKVACNTVKPFLPVMLDPELGIKIPTPITVHLDNCQQCARDLETIRGLNLSRIQSCRLSQFLANMNTKDTVNCSQAQDAITAVASMDFNKINEQILKHICKCENCRQALYEHRETVRTENQHKKRAQKCSICDKLSINDIFDYVVTYGLEPSNDQSATSRDSITQHLRYCPIGLKKIQELHRTIFHIAERAESNIVTIYKINESADTQVTGNSEDLYSGFPISVEIENREEEVSAKQPKPSINFVDALRSKIQPIYVNSLLRKGIIAVAVLSIAVTLFFRASVAGAVTFEQICTAIDKAKNIYISTLIPGKAEPMQERWISRTSNVFITKTGGNLVFWDFAQKVRKTKQLDIDSIQTSQLSDNIIADIEQNISNTLGLMPFYHTDIPPDAEWNRVTDSEQETAITSVGVYELTWISKDYNGSAVFKKWRFFIDSNTYLPQKIEVYRKFDAGDTYMPQSTIEVEYLSNGAMQKVIEEYSS